MVKRKAGESLVDITVEANNLSKVPDMQPKKKKKMVKGKEKPKDLSGNRKELRDMYIANPALMKVGDWMMGLGYLTMICGIALKAITPIYVGTIIGNSDS